MGTCCNWNTEIGEHLTGVCGDVCAAGNYQNATACSSNSDCANSETCCSWDASFGINAKGVCGQICAVGSFSLPANCTSNSACTGGLTCCNWDNNAGEATNGICGQVCLFGGGDVTTTVNSAQHSLPQKVCIVAFVAALVVLLQQP